MDFFHKKTTNLLFEPPFGAKKEMADWPSMLAVPYRSGTSSFTYLFRYFPPGQLSHMEAVERPDDLEDAVNLADIHSLPELDFPVSFEKSVAVLETGLEDNQNSVA